MEAVLSNIQQFGRRGLAAPIIVIAMLGNLHPIGVFFSSLFFSVIIVGAQTMSRMTGVPTYIAEVIQGMALMVMLIFLLFTEYKIRRVRKK